MILSKRLGCRSIGTIPTCARSAFRDDGVKYSLFLSKAINAQKHRASSLRDEISLIHQDNLGHDFLVVSI